MPPASGILFCQSTHSPASSRSPQFCIPRRFLRRRPSPIPIISKFLFFFHRPPPKAIKIAAPPGAARRCWQLLHRVKFICRGDSMWMRRSPAIRGNGVNAAANGTALPQGEPFNPNHRRYRSCCCHCKTFTLGFGVVELFLICFVLVAVAPDFNSKVCTFGRQQTGTALQQPEHQQEQQLQQHEEHPQFEQTPMPMPESNPTTTAPTLSSLPPPLLMGSRRRRQAMEGVAETNMPEVLAMLAQKMASSTPTTPAVELPAGQSSAEHPQQQEETTAAEEGFNTTQLLRSVTCSLTLMWLAWAVLQMCSIGLMCYGVKKQRWPLLLPHILLRFGCALAVCLVIAALVGALVHPGAHHVSISGNLALSVFLLLIFLWLCLLLKSEIRCCEFVKRSAETGFSVSNTRPIGPPTVSQSDSARGDHVRRVVQSGIRKMPSAGPSAKRYQSSRQQQQEEGPQPEMSTMSTLATGGGGLQTRPSTAGSFGTNGQGGSRGGSAEKRGPTLGGGAEGQQREEEEETNFGGQGTATTIGGGRPMFLPPLRHTYKMGG